MPPPLALALTLVLALATGDAVPAPVRAALEGALAVPGARLDAVQLRGALPPGCALTRAEAPRPVTASGDVPLRLTGTAPGGDCEAWVWARVRVRAPALVTARSVAEGEPLAGATAAAEREVLPGHAWLAALPEGAVAERTLVAGVALEPEQLRVGPRPGAPVRVVLRSGGVEISQDGRAVPCRRGRACALLPSGRRVEGAWSGGRLVLEMP